MNWNKHLTFAFLSWSRQEQYRCQFKKCVFDKIKQLNEIYKRFVKFNSDKKIELSKYINKLFIVLNTLWLKRTTEHSRFFDQLLIDVLFNIHQEIYCTLFDKFVDVVNDQTKIIIKKLQRKLNDAIIKWSKRFKLTNKSKMSVNNWLMLVKRMKILNSFSRFETLNDIKSLSFTNQKNSNKKWVKLKKNELYDFKIIQSSYEQHLNDICSAKNCSKLLIINKLITKVWICEKKAVFIIMSSTNSLIFYWIRAL